MAAVLRSWRCSGSGSGDALVTDVEEHEKDGITTRAPLLEVYHRHAAIVTSSERDCSLWFPCCHPCPRLPFSPFSHHATTRAPRRLQSTTTRESITTRVVVVVVVVWGALVVVPW